MGGVIIFPQHLSRDFPSVIAVQDVTGLDTVACHHIRLHKLEISIHDFERIAQQLGDSPVLLQIYKCRVKAVGAVSLRNPPVYSIYLLQVILLRKHVLENLHPVTEISLIGFFLAENIVEFLKKDIVTGTGA